MTAEQARHIANLKSKPVYRQLMENKIKIINKLIEGEAIKGRFNIIYNEYVSGEVVSELEKCGFTVKYYSNLMANENANSIEISW